MKVAILVNTRQIVSWELYVFWMNSPNSMVNSEAFKLFVDRFKRLTLIGRFNCVLRIIGKEVIVKIMTTMLSATFLVATSFAKAK